MTKMQIDLTKQLNKVVELYKIKNSCRTKQEALKGIIADHSLNKYKELMEEE